MLPLWGGRPKDFAVSAEAAGARGSRGRRGRTPLRRGAQRGRASITEISRPFAVDLGAACWIPSRVRRWSLWSCAVRRRGRPARWNAGRPRVRPPSAPAAPSSTSPWGAEPARRRAAIGPRHRRGSFARGSRTAGRRVVRPVRPSYQTTALSLVPSLIARRLRLPCLRCQASDGTSHRVGLLPPSASFLADRSAASVALPSLPSVGRNEPPCRAATALSLFPR